MASGPRIIGGNSDCRIGGRDFSLRGILSAASMSERSSDTGTNCDVEMRSADRPPPGGLGGMLVHWQWNCLWRGSSTSQRVTRLARSIIAPRSFVATVKRAWPPLMLTPRSLPVNRVAMSPPSGSATSVPSPRRCARAQCVAAMIGFAVSEPTAIQARPTESERMWAGTIAHCCRRLWRAASRPRRVLTLESERSALPRSARSPRLTSKR